MNSAHISDAVRAHIRASAGHRCGYCLSAQRYVVMGVLEIEHLIPRSLGGSDEESNLWLSCGLCNRFKGQQIEAVDPPEISARLFNPRADLWHEHFQWQAGGVMIQGITATGRATVVALKLNNEIALTVRHNWVDAGWHPPSN